MSDIPDRSKARPSIRTSAKKKFNVDEEIARLHSVWVRSGGKEGAPDDDKINISTGARDAEGNVRPDAIKKLRTDVDHDYNPNDTRWK